MMVKKAAAAAATGAWTGAGVSDGKGVLKKAGASARTAAGSFALLLACVLLLNRRYDAAAGVAAGITTCLTSLIPSLFPFVVLACVVSKSPAAEVLFRPLAPVMRILFRLPAAAAPALVFGLTAGYPTGAKITAGLLESGKLTREQAARLMLFCTAPGFAFAASYVGPVLGSFHTGLLLFAATGLAPLILGTVLARFAPPVERERRASLSDGAGRTGRDGFSAAVRDGVSAMVNLCAFVVVFSAVLSVLRGAGFFRAASAFLARLGLTLPLADTLLTFLIEVTAGTDGVIFWHLSAEVAAFGLGFAGLCIHMQLFSFFRGRPLPLSRAVYFLSRVLNGFLCAACYRALAYFFPAAEPAAVMTSPALAAVPAAGTWVGSLFLVMMSVIFLVAAKDKKDRTS